MTATIGLKSCKAKYGNFTFPKNDTYIGRSLAVFGQHCESEVQLFKQILRPGDIAVDAGANIGALAVPIIKILFDQGTLYAFELIKVYKPFLYLECDKPKTVDALYGYLDQFDYQYFWHISPLFTAENWKGYETDIFGHMTCVNLICAPRGAIVKNFKPAKGRKSHPKYTQ